MQHARATGRKVAFNQRINSRWSRAGIARQQ